MVDNRKKYTKKQLENLSIQELRRIDREVSTPSKQPIKPTRPRPTQLTDIDKFKNRQVKKNRTFSDQMPYITEEELKGKFKLGDTGVVDSSAVKVVKDDSTITPYTESGIGYLANPWADYSPYDMSMPCYNLGHNSLPFYSTTNSDLEYNLAQNSNTDCDWFARYTFTTEGGPWYYYPNNWEDSTWACDTDGYLTNDNGLSANEACCACGGGYKSHSSLVTYGPNQQYECDYTECPEQWYNIGFGGLWVHSSSGFYDWLLSGMGFTPCIPGNSYYDMAYEAVLTGCMSQINDYSTCASMATATLQNYDCVEGSLGGCTIESANNYDPDADWNDGSCNWGEIEYPSLHPCSGTSHGECLPDFSFSGYKYDREPIPSPACTDTYSTGAQIMNHSWNDGDVVCVQNGDYDITEDIFITCNECILRGNGDNVKFYLTNPELENFTNWTLGNYEANEFDNDIADAIKNIPRISITGALTEDVTTKQYITEDIPDRSHRVYVDDVSQYNVGDEVTIGWNTSDASNTPEDSTDDETIALLEEITEIINCITAAVNNRIGRDILPTVEATCSDLYNIFLSDGSPADDHFRDTIEMAMIYDVDQDGNSLDWYLSSWSCVGTGPAPGGIPVYEEDGTTIIPGSGLGHPYWFNYSPHPDCEGCNWNDEDNTPPDGYVQEMFRTSTPACCFIYQGNVAPLGLTCDDVSLSCYSDLSWLLIGSAIEYSCSDLLPGNPAGSDFPTVAAEKYSGLLLGEICPSTCASQANDVNIFTCVGGDFAGDTCYLYGDGTTDDCGDIDDECTEDCNGQCGDPFTTDFNMYGIWPDDKGEQPIFRRTVISTGDNYIDFDVPVRLDISQRWQPYIVQVSGYIENSGIENIKVSTAVQYHTTAFHRLWEGKDDYSSNGSRAIYLSAAKNCWIKNVHSFPGTDDDGTEASPWDPNPPPGSVTSGLCTISEYSNNTIRPIDDTTSDHCEDTLPNGFENPYPSNVGIGGNTHGYIGECNLADNASPCNFCEWAYEPSGTPCPSNEIWTWGNCWPAADVYTDMNSDDEIYDLFCDEWPDHNFCTEDNTDGICKSMCSARCGGLGYEYGNSHCNLLGTDCWCSCCNPEDIKDTFDGFMDSLSDYSGYIDSGDQLTNLVPEQKHLLSIGIWVEYSRNITIEDSTMSLPQNRGPGGNGYMFQLNQSNEILYRRCEGHRGRHNFLTGFHCSGVVYDDVITSGGWVFLDASDDYWSIHQQLEVIGLGQPGYSDTHRALNMALLIQKSTIKDGWSLINRGTLSGDAGLTAANSVFWNNTSQDPDPTAEPTWLTHYGNENNPGGPLDGQGMIKSYQIDPGWVIGNDVPRIYTDVESGQLDYIQNYAIDMSDIFGYTPEEITNGDYTGNNWSYNIFLNAGEVFIKDFLNNTLLMNGILDHVGDTCNGTVTVNEPDACLGISAYTGYVNDIHDISVSSVSIDYSIEDIESELCCGGEFWETTDGTPWPCSAATGYCCDSVAQTGQAWIAPSITPCWDQAMPEGLYDSAGECYRCGVVGHELITIILNNFQMDFYMDIDDGGICPRIYGDASIDGDLKVVADLTDGNFTRDVHWTSVDFDVDAQWFPDWIAEALLEDKIATKIAEEVMKNINFVQEYFKDIPALTGAFTSLFQEHIFYESSYTGNNDYVSNTAFTDDLLQWQKDQGYSDEYINVVINGDNVVCTDDCAIEIFSPKIQDLPGHESFQEPQGGPGSAETPIRGYQNSDNGGTGSDVSAAYTYCIDAGYSGVDMGQTMQHLGTHLTVNNNYYMPYYFLHPGAGWTFVYESLVSDVGSDFQIFYSIFCTL